MLMNVFDTEQEAIDAEAYDYSCHMAANPDKQGATPCTAWAEIEQRLTDNKYFYLVCPSSDATYTTETLDTGGAWRAEED